MTLELAGSPGKIDDFVALLLPYGLVETARSGTVSLERGRKAPRPDRTERQEKGGS
jgi:acetolactate synthase small subunit